MNRIWKLRCSMEKQSLDVFTQRIGSGLARLAIDKHLSEINGEFDLTDKNESFMGVKLDWARVFRRNW